MRVSSCNRGKWPPKPNPLRAAAMLQDASVLAEYSVNS